jgi:methionine biosynthesis protein MetW
MNAAKNPITTNPTNPTEFTASTVHFPAEKTNKTSANDTVNDTVNNAVNNTVITSKNTVLRPDQQYVAQWVKAGSRVLDLGCSDGALLAYLRDEKGCSVLGIDLADAAVLATLQRGIDVIQQDLESGLALFEDKAFDVVLQLETLQQMHHVKPMLAEIARVGRQAILSFPNFGYWEHRWQLLAGRMPISQTLPYQWFDTPNLRCATLHDFADLAANCGLQTEARAALHQGKPIHWLPNLRGSQAVFRFAA